MRRSALLFLLALLLLPANAIAQSGMVINGSRTIYGAFNTGVDAGSTDAYVITLTPPIPNYIVGTQYTFLANTANTGACTLNIDGKGVVPIKVRSGSVKVNPGNNAICAGQYVDVIYDGVDFQMLSQPCTAASGGVGDAIIANGLQQFPAAGTTSAQLATVLSDEVGTSGGFARHDGILVIPSGKTVTQSNTLTYTGTDGSSIAFGGGGTVAYTNSNVATATALAVNQPACTSGQFVTDMDANGTLTCSTPAGGGTVGTTGTPTSGQLPLWTSSTLLQGVTGLPATHMPALTGDVSNPAGSLSTTISAGVVTLAKMADLPTARILGRTTAGTGVPEALTVVPATLLPATTVNTVTSDTNVTGVISAQALTLGWTGTAAKARLLGTVVYTDQANTWSTGAQSLAAATSLLVPSAVGAAPTADGDVRYDTTKKALVVGHNADSTLTMSGTRAGCVQTGGNTNDAASGAGSDFAHTLTCTLPANFLTAGKIVKTCGVFRMTTGTSWPTMLWKLKAGTTTLLSTNGHAPDNQFSNRSQVMCFFTMATGAPGGAVNTHSGFSAYPSAFENSFEVNITPQPVALATNASQVFGLVTQWGSTISGNTLALDAAWVEVMN